jgi:hypothetical protein
LRLTGSKAQQYHHISSLLSGGGKEKNYRNVFVLLAGTKFFYSFKYPDRLWGLPCLLFNRYWEHFPSG